MKLMKLAETVLLQLECFWVLQEIDEGVRTEQPGALSFLDSVYARRPVGWRELHPYLRLNTTLAQLLLPISFVARLTEEELSSLGFRVEPHYDVVCREGGQSCQLSPRDFLVVIRNAVAHLPDFAAGTAPDVNISFDDGILRCWTQTRSREVIFRSEEGFFAFLQDFVRVCRSAAGEITRQQ